MTLEEQRKAELKYAWDSCGNNWDWTDFPRFNSIEGVNWVSKSVTTYQKPKQSLIQKIVKVLTYKLF